MTVDFTTRFAPSPTGYLHLGHAFSALSAHDAARAESGKFLLRIEDIDQGRCKPEFEHAICDDLTWLGIAWDAPPLRQSDRLDLYTAHLERLIEMGVCYRCFKTRKDVNAALNAPHNQADQVFRSGPLPPAEEADLLASGAAFAWRLSIEAVTHALNGVSPPYQVRTDGDIQNLQVDLSQISDEVLCRKDAGTSYHLSSVVDDHLSGVTHIVRGTDLAGAAPLHRLLYALWDWPCPTYTHHRLITDDQGRRLAKRDQDKTLRAFRAEGVTPDTIRAQLFSPRA